MRISTKTMFDAGAARLSDLQASLLKTQQQISTGRKILTPADDPVASARALEVSQAQSANTQYGVNRQNVKGQLSQVEGTLQSVTSVIQDMQTLTVSAGNGILNDSQRKYLANELSGHFQELLGLANSRDGTGNYMFAGFQTNTKPFAETSTGATYSGDQGQRFVQVGPARQIAVGMPGDLLFDSVKTGNQSFVTSAASTNTGLAVITQGTVIDATATTGHNYDINFSVIAGVTTYDVVDTTTATTVSTGNQFTSGQAISFDGIQFEITGAPQNGDKFTVAPAANQSLFKTIKDLINVLNMPAIGEAAKAQLQNGLSAANSNLSNALDNVLAARVTVGANLKEIESLDSAGEDRNIQYSQILADLQELDYTKAITELTQQQTTLEAAQKSYVKTTGLSVFDYI